MIRVSFFSCEFTFFVGRSATERFSAVVAESLGVEGIVMDVRQLQDSDHWGATLGERREGERGREGGREREGVRGREREREIKVVYC